MNRPWRSVLVPLAHTTLPFPKRLVALMFHNKELIGTDLVTLMYGYLTLLNLRSARLTDYIPDDPVKLNTTNIS